MLVFSPGLLFAAAVILASQVHLPLMFGDVPESVAAGPASAAPREAWDWPLSPRPAVVRSFDAPERPWLSGHRGVDLASAPAQELHSPAPGVVVFAGQVVDRPVVTVDHGNGLRSSFEPIETTLSSGDRVEAGQTIGRLWNEGTHCRAGPCVHWGVRDGDDYVNPLKFLADTRPSILLPWSE